MDGQNDRNTDASASNSKGVHHSMSSLAATHCMLGDCSVVGGSCVHSVFARQYTLGSAAFQCGRQPMTLERKYLGGLPVARNGLWAHMRDTCPSDTPKTRISTTQ